MMNFKFKNIDNLRFLMDYTVMVFSISLEANILNEKSFLRAETVPECSPLDSSPLV